MEWSRSQPPVPAWGPVLAAGTLVMFTCALGLIGVIGVAPAAGLSAPVAADSPHTTASPDIYVANYGNGTVTAYPPTSIGDAAPAATISSNNGSLDGPSEMAFDKHGDLWVPNGSNDTVTEFTPTQLASTAAPPPAATLLRNGTSLRTPAAVAFDASGDMWVSNSGGDTIAEYSPAQLTALTTVDNPVPAATLKSTTRSLTAPWGIAFDSSGNLWIANVTSSTVVEFSTSDLTGLSTLGNPVPTTTISNFDIPYSISFDSSGNMWAANCTSTVPTVHGNIVEFPKTQLKADGNVSVILTNDSSGSLNCPRGLYFGPNGDLWVTNFDISPGGVLGSAVEFSPSQLALSGSPTPIDTIKGTGTKLDEPMGIAIPPTSTSTGTGTKTKTKTKTGTHTGSGTKTKTKTGTGSKTSAHTHGSTGSQKTTPTAAPTPTRPFTPTHPGSRRPPSVTSISPASGPAAGVTMVTIKGGGFHLGSTVLFGGVVSPAVHVLKNGLITAVAPEGEGVVPVTVRTDEGTSLSGPRNHFAYLGGGYDEVASDGGLFSFGDSQFLGSMGGKLLNAPVVGIATEPIGGGYWEVASDGGLFAFGSAPFYGSMGGRPLNKPVVAMSATPTGAGYWEVASDGGLFSFGSAAFFGSMGGRVLNAPVIGIAVVPGGSGYWEVASDGGLFAFGSSPFFGSMGGRQLNKPVVGMAPSPTRGGYWEVASDGGIFSFGTATFYGSMGAKPLNKPVVAMGSTADGKGYWEVASDGGLFSFGDSGFYGSMGAKPLNKPVVGFSST